MRRLNQKLDKRVEINRDQNPSSTNLLKLYQLRWKFKTMYFLTETIFFSGESIKQCYLQLIISLTYKHGLGNKQLRVTKKLPGNVVIKLHP